MENINFMSKDDIIKVLAAVASNPEFIKSVNEYNECWKDDFISTIADSIQKLYQDLISNSQELQKENQVKARIVLFDEYKKLRLIKCVREWFHKGLKDAKDDVEMSRELIFEHKFAFKRFKKTLPEGTILEESI